MQKSTTIYCCYCCFYNLKRTGFNTLLKRSALILLFYLTRALRLCVEKVFTDCWNRRSIRLFYSVMLLFQHHRIYIFRVLQS